MVSHNAPQWAILCFSKNLIEIIRVLYNLSVFIQLLWFGSSDLVTIKTIFFGLLFVFYSFSGSELNFLNLFVCFCYFNLVFLFPHPLIQVGLHDRISEKVQETNVLKIFQKDILVQSGGRDVPIEPFHRYTRLGI